jgi:hypothetical protein
VLMSLLQGKDWGLKNVFGRISFDHVFCVPCANGRVLIQALMTKVSTYENNLKPLHGFSAFL